MNKKIISGILGTAIIAGALAFAFVHDGGQAPVDTTPSPSISAPIMQDIASPQPTAAASSAMPSDTAAPTATTLPTQPPQANTPSPTADTHPTLSADNIQTGSVTTATAEKHETVNPTQPPKSEQISTPSPKTQCSISIRCDTVFNNLKKLKSGKEQVIPADGVILKTQSVTFDEGDSVFDVLRSITKTNKIHLEFEKTPSTNSVYVEGISNLYEFDCGDLSGWMYKVNGEIPNVGMSEYKLKNNDKVEILYTCDMGADIGGKKF